MGRGVFARYRHRVGWHHDTVRVIEHAQSDPEADPPARDPSNPGRDDPTRTLANSMVMASGKDL